MNDNLFQKATLAHSQNNLKEAENLYLKLLNKNSKNHQVHFLLGTLYLQKKLPKKALSHLKKSEHADKNNPHLLMNLGLAYKEAGDMSLAEIYLKKSLAIDPKHADSFNNLGALQLSKKNYVDAELNFRKALEIKPNEDAYLINLSDCLFVLGIKDEPINLLLKIQRGSDFYQEAQKKLFNIFLKNKNYRDAISYGRAILENDDDVFIKEKLINAYLKIGELNEAETLLAKIDSNSNPFFFNQGAIEAEKGNYVNAEKLFNKILNSKEYCVLAQHNLGIIKFKQRLFNQAIDHFENALKNDKNFGEAKMTLGLCQLSQYQFKSGWDNFLTYQDSSVFNFSLTNNIPKWKGHTTDKTIMIIFDQGVGDQIFFSRLLNYLDSVNQYICVVNKKLISLFAKSFNDSFIFKSIDQINKDMNIDFHCRATELGKIFIKSRDDMKPIQYLFSEPQIFQEESPIGLAWYSNNSVIGRRKSIDLDALVSSLKHKSRFFVNLQYGDHDNEIRSVEKKHQVTFIDHGNDNFNNIDQLSRIIMGCREVYSISNTSAHLSAALGHPTHVILPYNHAINSWYWFQDKSKKSLWYANTVVIEAMQNKPINNALKQIT